MKSIIALIIICHHHHHRLEEGREEKREKKQHIHNQFTFNKYKYFLDRMKGRETNKNESRLKIKIFKKKDKRKK